MYSHSVYLPNITNLVDSASELELPPENIQAPPERASSSLKWRKRFGGDWIGCKFNAKWNSHFVPRVIRVWGWSTLSKSNPEARHLTQCPQQRRQVSQSRTSAYLVPVAICVNGIKCIKTYKLSAFDYPPMLVVGLSCNGKYPMTTKCNTFIPSKISVYHCKFVHCKHPGSHNQQLGQLEQTPSRRCALTAPSLIISKGGWIGYS